MKILEILKTSNTNLIRSKLRTFLTILAIFVGTTTLTLTNGLAEGIRDFTNKQISSVSADNLIIVTPGEIAPDTSLKEYSKETTTPAITVFTDKDIEKIKEIENVTSVYRVQTAQPEYIYIENQDKKLTIANGIDLNLDGVEAPLAAGRLIQNNDEMVISYEYIEGFGYQNAADLIGKKVYLGVENINEEVKEFEFTIVGVGIKSLFGSVPLINADKMQELIKFQYQADSKGGVAPLYVTTKKGLSDEEFDEVNKKIKDAGYSSLTVDDQIAGVNTVIDIIQTVLNGFAVIVILAAGIGIINTLLMSVYERTREIGLMKALGMKSGEVFGIFAFEAMLIGFWGGLAGILTGMGIGMIVNEVISQSLFKDFEGLALMVFPFHILGFILLSTMILGILAGTLPALKASRLNPIVALRYE